MTDLADALAPAGDVVIPGSPPSLGGLLPTAVDLEQQLAAIGNVEKTWPFPELPDTVKLDLIGSTFIPGAQEMGEFLMGLASDIGDAVTPKAAPPVPDDVLGLRSDMRSQGLGPQAFATSQSPNAPINQFRKAVAGITGMRSNAEVVGQDPNQAIIEAQIKAIERGLLPEEAMLPENLGRWTPQHRSAFYEVARAEQEEWFAGDRPGAISFNKGLELMDRWASPASLVMSALSASFVPSPGQIADEFSNWGDSIGNFVSSGLKVLTGDVSEIDDLFTNAWSALGPIDDIAFPLMNTAMLFSGVGSTIAFASAASRSARLSRALGTFGRFGAGPLDDIIRAGGIPTGPTSSLGAIDDVMRYARPGFIASKFSHSTRLAGQADRMAKWRQRAAVLTTKKAVAETAKLGFTAQAQSLLSPNVGGLGLPEIYRGVTGAGTGGELWTPVTQKQRLDAMYAWRTTNPIAYPFLTAMDTAFVPPSVFQPGTFTNPVRKVATAASHRWTELSKDEAITALFYEVGMMQMAVNDPDRHAKLLKIATSGPRAWDRVRRKVPDAVSGPHAVVVDIYGGGDASVAGGKMQFLATAAGLDHLAKNFAGSIDDPVAWANNYHRHRNHLLNQIRFVHFDADTFDPTDELHLLEYLRLRTGMTADIADMGYHDALNARRALMETLTDAYQNDFDGFVADARTAINRYHTNRSATFERVYDSLNEGVLAQYLVDNVDNLEDWDSFIDANHMLHDTILDVYGDGDIRYLSVDETLAGFGQGSLEPAGLLAPTIHGEAAVEDLTPVRSWTKSLIGEHLDHPLSPSMIESGPLTTMADDFVAADTHFVPARLATPTKQDILLVAGSDERGGLVRLITDRLRGLGRIDDATGVPALDQPYLASLEEWAATHGDLDVNGRLVPKDIADLTSSDLRQWANERSVEAGGALTDAAGRAVSIDELADYGRSVAYLAANGKGTRGSRQFLEEVLTRIDEAPLWEALGIDNARFPTIDDKVAEARRMLPFVAAEVDIGDPVMAARLADKGYKAVAGRDFLQVADLIGLDSPLAEISLTSLRRRSLGSFFGRTGTDVIFDMRRGLAEGAVGAQIQRAIDIGRWDDAVGFDTSTGSPHIQWLMDALADKKHRIGESLADALDEADDPLGRFLARASLNKNTPLSTLDMRPQQVLKALQEASNKQGSPFKASMWNLEHAKAIVAGLKRGKVLGYDVSGLANIEDKLIANGLTRSALKLFSYTDANDDVVRMAGWKRTLGVGDTRPELDLYRRWKLIGGSLAAGAVGGVVAANAEQDPRIGVLAGVVGTPAVEGVANVMGASVLNTRTLARIFLAQTAAQTTQGVLGEEGLSPASFTAGLAGATVGVGGLRALATAGVRSNGFLDKAGWANYSKLGDQANQLRNMLRFSLSPVFDAQRYTEGMMLLQTSEFGPDIPMTHRPMRAALRNDRIRARFGDAEGVRQAYRQTLRAGGEEWFEAIEETQRIFRDEGILGFSPTDWQAAAWAFVMERNPTMSAQAAAEKVRNILTYGTQGRSGLEQSINFVFFPFSFQKKYLTQLASFAADDIGRLMLITEGLKVHEILDNEFNLTEMWEDRFPVLDQLRKFNALAMGFSPGEFGGINRPYYDIVTSTPFTKDLHEGIVNAFIPQAMQIKTFEDSRNTFDRVRRVVPLWRDGEDLIRDVLDQGHVLSSPSHLAGAAQRRKGYEEYSDLRSAVQTIEREVGIALPTLLNPNNVQYAEFQHWYNGQIADLGHRYPQWRKARSEANVRRQEKAQDLKLLRLDRDTGRASVSPAQDMVLQLDDLVNQAEAVVRDQMGGDFGANLDLMPLAIQEGLRRIALEMANRDPRFIILYDRYFKSTLGPITVGV